MTSVTGTGGLGELRLEVECSDSTSGCSDSTSGSGGANSANVGGMSMSNVETAVAALERRSKPHCPQNIESVCTEVPQLGQLVVAGKGV